jgi:hypothetical protein
MSGQSVVADQVDETLIVRSQRFAIQLPLRYRLRAESAWRRGETINVSSSGVLFWSDCFAEANTPVSINLIMPAVNSEGAAEVVCRGTIVRAMPSSSAGGQPALAIKILQYRLIRP